MLRLKTHFDQVPLEIVRKMVEEQIRREAAAEQAQRNQEEHAEEDPSCVETIKEIGGTP